MIRAVLLVDDDKEIRSVGLLSLGAVGRRTTFVAASGAEALELAERERPDVILRDVMLPGEDGIAVLTELRRRPETAAIPVVFITAKARQSEIVRDRRPGAAGVVTKPFDPMALPGQIRRIVEGGR